MAFSLPPDQAWQPLAPTNWNAETAGHLLRRAGWTARAEDVRRAVSEGLAATLDRLFPATALLLPKPESIQTLEDSELAMRQELQGKSGDERRRLERERRERERIALQDLSLKWLTFAADPQNAAAAKWTLFLSDVYVVSAEKVKNAALIYQHFDIITQHGFRSAPELTKAISRSPAMVHYLDLNQSRREAPNENFARELFELFVLGEGNYTEKDIKEAARAFTGYRDQPPRDEFRFLPRQHDSSRKTVFGATGSFTGDDVIDLAYGQPAASAFIPHELVKFYLSDSPLPREYLVALGDGWRAAKFDLRWMAHHFFGSQLFFAPEFRGTFIKSPIQFYLGMLQDLQLEVPPLARLSLNPLRQMGQPLFYPPNVRGWVGGRNWINSATIIARRQLVETLFAPINERALNADEKMELSRARAEGRDNFTVTQRFKPLAELPPAQAATELVRTLLVAGTSTEVPADIEQFIAAAGSGSQGRLHAANRAAATLLQSPQYQLT